MQVYVPAPLRYPGSCPAHQVQQHILRPYGAHRVWLDGETDYPDWLAERWRAGETFINLEWDVLPWPGAIDEIEACAEPLCAFAYEERERFDCWVLLGLVKFGAEFIARTPELWEGAEWPYPRTWALCEARLTHWLTEHRAQPHQHFPAVLHGNLNFRYRRRDEERAWG